jgi:hypothetical protein
VSFEVLRQVPPSALQPNKKYFEFTLVLDYQASANCLLQFSVMVAVLVRPLYVEYHNRLSPLC